MGRLAVLSTDVASCAKPENQVVLIIKLVLQVYTCSSDLVYGLVSSCSVGHRGVSLTNVLWEDNVYNLHIQPTETETRVAIYTYTLLSDPALFPLLVLMGEGASPAVTCGGKKPGVAERQKREQLVN